ncbi:MAG TPA: helix-turn-helix domain-containing protein [Micrococcaceae bacterium]|jgi:excisionase family DNA binding protein|nr:helix-turn-helix domain-containing protein [Micrococcaceae bacterium]
MSDENGIWDDTLLSVSEIAEHLKVSKMTVYRLIRAGKLDAVRIGHSFRVTLTAVETYVRGAQV